MRGEEEDSVAPPVEEEEREEAVRRSRHKTAPGLDGIPGRALTLALNTLGPRVRGLFTACLAQAIISQRWKTGRLVLIKKEGRPADSASSYRPIVQALKELGDLGQERDRQAL